MSTFKKKHIALVTAKGGNQSLPNKNILPIAGKPSFLHSVEAARASGVISEIWVTSEDERIQALALGDGVQVIKRPTDLSQPLTNHGDVILHAFEFIKSQTGAFDTMTILLGNTAMTRGSDIRGTVEALDLDPSASSSMTVWVAQDDHPYRAMFQTKDGYLRTFLEGDRKDTNRQSYPEVLFYDQGPWTVRFNTLTGASRENATTGPWWWMGEKSVPIRRTWLTGRDTHTAFDLAAQEWWLSGDHPEPLI